MLWLGVAITISALIAGVIYFYFFVDDKGPYERAMDLANRGNFTDARAIIRTRIDRDPANVTAHYNMAQIYAMEKSPAGEIQHLMEIVKLNSFPAGVSPAEILNRLGEIHYEAENFQTSFQFYLESLNHTANNEEALARLAFMCIGQEEFEFAENYFRKLVEIAPFVLEYRIARGVGLAMLKKKECLDEFAQALQIQPDNPTARFLMAFQSYHQNDFKQSAEHLGYLLGKSYDPGVDLMIHKLAAAVFFQNAQYPRALESADRCLDIAQDQRWIKEEYDARLSVALLSLRAGELEKAGENLFELEIRNPADELVLRISDFRMDVEEGIAELNEISPRGFDYKLQMKDWLRNRFPPDSVYKMSGLRMEERFDIKVLYTTEGRSAPAKAAAPVNHAELIDTFNELPDAEFLNVCQKIITLQGYKTEKPLPKRDRDGVDYIAADLKDKKVKALFSFRKWSNEPISDIFLRNMQNQLNELKVHKGFVVAGARLTPGAEAALQNLKKIKVINEGDFGQVLTKVLK